MIDLAKLRLATAKADEYLARYALAAGTRRAETTGSVPKGNAQKVQP
jgi:hypothetical protein